MVNHSLLLNVGLFPSFSPANKAGGMLQHIHLGPHFDFPWDAFFAAGLLGQKLGTFFTFNISRLLSRKVMTVYIPRVVSESALFPLRLCHF